ncbi:MAG: serine hydrolase domain-containing protein [Sphingorhabdus sp.]
MMVWPRLWPVLCLMLLIVAVPVQAKNGEAAESWNPDLLRRIGTLAKQAGFEGDIAIDSDASAGPMQMYYGPWPAKAPQDQDRWNWRWASVTKQVVAVLLMQEVAKGTIDLDAPLAHYLPHFKSPNADKITVRFLLRHQSGLPNPDDEPDFYESGYKGSRDPLTGYCAGSPKGQAGAAWSYNNCDYMVAGALLESITRKPWRKLVDERIARLLKLKSLGAFPSKRWTRPGLVNGEAEAETDLAAYGASAGLFGSALDMLAFDKALMDGKLLSLESLETLWDGRPELGYVALGQWVFEAPLAGCDKPVRIVERRGAIGGVQVRNLMVPQAKAAVVAITDRGEFDFGEIWQRSGFSYDLISAAVCIRGLRE